MKNSIRARNREVGGSTMRLLAEMEYDLDFRRIRVTAVENYVIVESFKEITMITQTAVTVKNDRRYVTVVGENFVLREISEGRMVVEGTLQRIEFL